MAIMTTLYSVRAYVEKRCTYLYTIYIATYNIKRADHRSFARYIVSIDAAMKILLVLRLAAATLVCLLLNGRVAANICSVMMTSAMDPSECPSVILEYDNECKTLQEVLNHVSRGSDPGNCAVVYVHTGDHYLTSPVNFSANSVHIIGVGNNISIICNYSEVHESSASAYMWLFENTRNIIIRNLNFYACPYPFRIQYAKDVYVADSSFRLVSFMYVYNYIV